MTGRADLNLILV